MGERKINFKRGFLRLWVIFTVVWLVIFAGTAVKNFYQCFWVTHQQDLARYQQTLIDNAELKKERCDGPTPGKRCSEHAIEGDPSSPTNAELDKSFDMNKYFSPPSRPTMMPLFSGYGFELIFKYFLIGLAGPITVYVIGAGTLWAARGFVVQPF